MRGACNLFKLTRRFFNNLKDHHVITDSDAEKDLESKTRKGRRAGRSAFR